MTKVCLSFGSMKTSYVETADGDYIDEPDEIRSFKFESTDGLDESALARWCHEYLEVEFDGDLDNPDVFSKINAFMVYGPNSAKYGDEGMTIDGASIYFEVSGDDEISEEDIDDLFHIVVPVLKFGGAKMAFTAYEEYEATFEDPPTDGRVISVHWANDG